MAIDWLRSTNKQRIDLYEAVVRLFKMRELTIEILFKDALGKNPATISSAFTDNFRKGKISAANAALIYRYLSKNHPDSIPALDEAASTAREFRQFLLHHRRLGAIEMLPEMIGEPFRVNRLGPEWAEYPFEIGDPICFRLRLPHVYVATCALNWTLAGWFPMALQEPTDYELAEQAPPVDWLKRDPFIKAVTQGFQTVCSAPPTDAERKRRRHNNSFVFLIGSFAMLRDISTDWSVDRRVTDADLDRIANRFISEKIDGWAVTQINSYGIGPYDDD